MSVIAGLDPEIHHAKRFFKLKGWMRGSPRMTLVEAAIPPR
jgi:hypothetical protein